MKRTALVLSLLLMLAGCAGTYRVDSAVQSYARWGGDIATGLPATRAAAPAAPQTYRFERLPSQARGQPGESQDRLEAWAQDALQAHGWTLAPTPGATAPWRVEVAGIALRAEDPWADADGRWRFHGHFVTGNGHVFLSPMFAMPLDRPWVQRQVVLVIRDAATGQVVYETRASHEGRWNSTPALWQAMLQAALRDFPMPPEGTRQIDIDLPY